MLRQRPPETSARIRETAAELFAAHGYEGTSLREIAERVGITKAALYYHYPSKEALLHAIVQPLLDDLRDLVDETTHMLEGAEAKRRFIEDYLGLVLRHRWVCAILFRDLTSITAIGAMIEQLKAMALKLQVVLGGPDPTSEHRVRAAAALEALSVALAAPAFLPDVPEDVLRRTLLDAAAAILRLEDRD